MACSGCGGPCPPCPQSLYIRTLDPTCPVEVENDTGVFVDILSQVVPVAAGLPSFGVAVIADLVAQNSDDGLAGFPVRLVDVGPDGSTTVFRILPGVSIPAGTTESIAIIGGLNNLSAGNHTIKLQAAATTAEVNVIGAGMQVQLVQMVTFSVTEECVAG